MTPQAPNRAGPFVICFILMHSHEKLGHHARVNIRAILEYKPVWLQLTVMVALGHCDVSHGLGLQDSHGMVQLCLLASAFPKMVCHNVSKIMKKVQKKDEPER